MSRDEDVIKRDDPEDDAFSNEDLDDINFSEVAGKHKTFKKSLSAVRSKVKEVKKTRATKKKKPLNKFVKVGAGHTKIEGDSKKKISKVIVPADQKVVIQHVNKFILSSKYDWMKDLHHYNGEKLKEVVLIFDNSASAVDVTLDLFDPSSRIDYIMANGGQDVNDLVQVPGSAVRYSDILHNILANPIMVVNARFILDGSNTAEQTNQSIFIKNKSIEGWQKTNPIAMMVKIDIDQQQRNIITFNFTENLNRPFIPDGMDVAQYKVLAGNSVTMVFWVKQFSLKKMLFDEAANTKQLLL